MTYLEINTIVARHFGTTTDKLMNSGKNIARPVAMLICKDALNASTIKLAKWYGKNQHTTPMRALRTAHNLIDTNKSYRNSYKAPTIEVKAALCAELEKKTIKQIYNLNHRVREKGIVVRTRSRTPSIPESALDQIDDQQLKKLLTNHRYTIQLSIL